MDNRSAETRSSSSADRVFAVTPFATLDNQPAQSAGNDAVSLGVLPHCVKVNLRGPHASCKAAISEVTGIALPDAPNTCKHGEHGSLFWLGPDEWQFRSPGEDAASWVLSLRNALHGVHSAVVDVSDYSVLMSLQGSAHLDVIEKLTPLNVRALLAESQHCAQTRFANAPVFLHRAQPDTVHIQVRWSYAEYLCTYLQDAMREFVQSAVKNCAIQ